MLWLSASKVQQRSSAQRIRPNSFIHNAPYRVSATLTQLAQGNGDSLARSRHTHAAHSFSPFRRGRLRLFRSLGRTERVE
eukprot:scaffold86606_cov32-Tisochrysis_lutea.AAC.2